MFYRSKPPYWLISELVALLALFILSSTPLFLHAQETESTPIAPAAATTPTTSTPTTPVEPTTPPAVPQAILPATPEPGSHAIAAPAPEPINPGFSGASNDPTKPVAVHITSPKPEEVLTSSTVDIFFTVDNYSLAEGGNRLHVILDNADPVPVHDLLRPFTRKELPEGGHTIRVFAVQPDGHSLPNPEAFAIIRFYVRKKNFQNYVNPATPYLTVNLPTTGIIDVEDGGRVWFDFRVHNAKLSANGYKVHYKINDVNGTIAESRPVFWDGMKPGRYELFAELLDASNTPVMGVFNQVRRSFDVRAVVKALPAEPETPATPAPTSTNHSPAHPAATVKPPQVPVSGD